MSPEQDRATQEIDLDSRRLFVNTVRGQLPPTEWRRVHVGGAEEHSYDMFAQLLGLDEPLSKEFVYLMSSAVHNIGENTLKLVYNETPDIDAYVEVQVFHKPNGPETKVESYEVKADLSETSYSVDDFHSRPSYDPIESVEDIFKAYERVDQERQLEELSGSNLFTVEKFNPIMRSLAQCNNENRVI